MVSVKNKAADLLTFAVWLLDLDIVLYFGVLVPGTSSIAIRTATSIPIVLTVTGLHITFEDLLILPVSKFQIERQY